MTDPSPRTSSLSTIEATTHKERVREQFAGSAEAYIVSPGHAAGDDLAELTAWAAAITPSHSGSPVSSRTSHAWATCCIQVPTSEIAWPPKKSR